MTACHENLFIIFGPPPPVEIFHWSHVELKSKVHETGIREN